MLCTPLILYAYRFLIEIYRRRSFTLEPRSSVGNTTGTLVDVPAGRLTTLTRVA